MLFLEKSFFFSLSLSGEKSRQKYVWSKVRFTVFYCTQDYWCILKLIQVAKPEVNWEHFVVEAINCQQDFLLRDSMAWNFKPCLTVRVRPIRNCSLNCTSFSPITEALWLLLHLRHSFFFSDLFSLSSGFLSRMNGMAAARRSILKRACRFGPTCGVGNNES